jgi:hypothetical protein
MGVGPVADERGPDRLRQLVGIDLDPGEGRALVERVDLLESEHERDAEQRGEHEQPLRGAMVPTASHVRPRTSETTYPTSAKAARNSRRPSHICRM